MKKLKTILSVIYPILALLLLLNFKGHHHSENDYSEPYIPALDTMVSAPNERTPPSPPPTHDSRLVERARSVGNIGSLKITLLWDFPGDIDLHVRQPNGSVISYLNTRDGATGGFLDVDNRRGGAGAAENMYWARAPRGEYQVSLNYYSTSTSTGTAGSGICTVVVFQQGKETKIYKVRMSNVGETKHVTRVVVDR